ncbi:hypothetical protein LD125_00230 [Mesoplasma sp. JKS002658]|uniref:hypothetical protein n=1 Tax=Mesoplasma whartonense TaxID=2878854 RepID=UPI002022A2D2|nr:MULTISPECIES: hypothetical protein [unclassified Mesoplasma]MCL8211259.1 hypothetical protein [Mesoplasma sp. JKS002664]MCL8211920.1 hypothetical protein [Mesoplasma sp. JKS002662]MCL8212847.1 hypothetical protein [Mesoplasma sp. JKS002661]MCL8213096.1 hypothetical protein [Mesoplasma sp. JKS002660]MCL8213975.1 hypothetical protein [Mesoplasma sp. JKS002658]
MFKQSWIHYWHIFVQLLKIQFLYWSQNIMNLFLGIGVSLYTMICWLAFKSDDPFLMISGISVGLVRNALYIHLKTNLDFRSKKWDNQLTLTPLPAWLNNLASVTFNVLSTMFICTFMLVVALIFFDEQRTLLGHSNQGMIWVGFILAWLTSYVIASFIFIYIKSNKLGQMVGLSIYFTTMYFLGLGFPFERIISVKWLNYVLYIHPFRYVMNIVQAGFVDSPNFFYQHDQFDFGYQGMGWLPYLLAVIMIILYWTLYKIRFNYLYAFHRRNKYGEFVVKESSARYISQLRRAKSSEEVKNLHQEHSEMLKNKSPSTKKIVEQVEHESWIEFWFKNRNNGK